ncbi:MAG: hypothetical protein CM1200mP16_16570 [Nitrospina sp.]|nr:MAG: hypothetical protein CM1200mP16_16570 [Nitrospina sp.]
MKKTALLTLFFSLCFPCILFAKEDGMVLIKSGCFIMGTNQNATYEDDDDNSREKPAHKVCLGSFYLEPMN